MNKLYGNGINDDTAAIQELIDHAGGELRLPMPQVCYLISKPLELPSNFKLVLPRYAEIKLAKNSNCFMLKNKTVEAKTNSGKPDILFYLNEWSPDAPCYNIEIEGGIWNFNNREQCPNPMWPGVVAPKNYTGFGCLFYNVQNFRMSSLTLKDPVNFAVTLDTVSYFTIDNIIFDFNYGNPIAVNMDGIHLNGNCHFGNITNLKGACYDDLVALNADEGSAGPITNITINGIYAEDCHSAIRLLSSFQDCPVKNVHISNVYGTYYQYCIGITRINETTNFGVFDGITIDNVYASKAIRYPIYGKPETDYVCPIIFMDDKMLVKTLKIAELHRREYNIPSATIVLRQNTVIEHLVLENITTENHTDSDRMPLFQYEICDNKEWIPVNDDPAVFAAKIQENIKHLYTNILFENGKEVTL